MRLDAFECIIQRLIGGRGVVDVCAPGGCGANKSRRGTSGTVGCAIAQGEFRPSSTDGIRFVGRIWTVVATLRQQKRNVLASLTEACEATIQGEKAPSLLPNEMVGSQPTG